MESLKNRRDAREKIKNPGTLANPVTGEHEDASEHDKSLANIFADKKAEALFHSFLDVTDPVKSQEVKETMASGTVLTDVETKWLDKQRKEFNQRTFETTHLRESLTAETIGNLSSLDPRIKTIVGLIGPEKAADFLGKEFSELAYSDANTFKKMSKALHGLHSVESRPSSLALERKFRDALFAHGISETQFIDITEKGPTHNASRELGALAARQYGFFKNSISLFTPYFENRDGRKLAQIGEEQKQLLKEMDTHLKVVGKTLAMTLNPDVNMAIQKYILEGGTLDSKKEQLTVTGISEFAGAKNTLDKSAVQRQFDALKISEGKKRKIKDWSTKPVFFEDLKEQFASDEFARQNTYKAKGVFATLLAMLFRTKDEIKSSLT